MNVAVAPEEYQPVPVPVTAVPLAATDIVPVAVNLRNWSKRLADWDIAFTP